MPIDIPAGYVTRPAAAEAFNRSQRALERDVDVAILTQDEEALAHWKLITKDGTERPAKDVTTDLVKQLQADGMLPTWCVVESFLEREYGRKGEPKPQRSASSVPATTTGSAKPSQQHEQDPPRQTSRTGESAAPNSTPADVEFFKDRILRLEEEMASEKERHDKIVEKLFDQLAVKDKQISAWDEVTQGLTKALATGQIMPMLPSAIRQAESHENAADSNVQEAAVVEEPAAPAKTSATKQPSQRRSPPKKRAATKSAANAPKYAKGASKTSAQAKPKWYETPTINRVASRFFSR